MRNVRRGLLQAAITSGIMLACFVDLIAAKSQDFVGVDSHWKLYRSPNFELFSHWRDQPSRELLQHLELLRALFFDANHLAEREPLEVTVFAFATRREFEAYCSVDLKLASGYYLAHPDRAVISLVQSSDSETGQLIIYHEYIHHLTKISGQHPPMWLNEGMAELFSTVEATPKTLVIGKPIASSVAQLLYSKPIPLAVLFSSDQASVFAPGQKHAGLFYAQSWALLHYWYFGDAGVSLDRVQNFLRKLMSSPTATNADEMSREFREATGMDYATAEKKLSQYMLTGRYSARSIPRPKIDPPESYSVSALDVPGIRDRLAELALRTVRDPRGKFAMLKALDGQTRVRALEVLGSDEYAGGNPTAALLHWQEALDAGSRNPAVYHMVGQLEGWPWFAQFDYFFRMPLARTERLRALLLKSIEVAPDQIDAYELLAWVEASAPEPAIRNVNLVQRKFDTLRNRARTLVALAMVRIRVGDLESARSMLDDVAKLSPEPAALQAVEFIRAQLVATAPSSK